MKMSKGFHVIVLLLLLGAAVIWVTQEHERREELANVPMPTELHPIVEESKNELVDRAADKGIEVVITDGFRSKEEQDEIYAQGRTTEGSIVSYAEGGESYHNYGLAIDFALRTESGNVVWDMEYDGNNNGKSDWMEVVDIAKDLGFEWGGDFARFNDYPHLQMTFGLSIRELQRGERPDITIE
ncbi:M15 family metallopeptidase [Jeotgalibacillus proteolyticus]|uniref:Peptidase n=1 Tax=Jeotgalibacillus proteolyticus TaxID=2082395 RepID=A0A2S5GDS1_9BACL|nr:M15 family metallopeptidase [Jeotgalibacillus proteolyticus]PPA71139.1 peptidase [Jeotgalibacillus proteolyticus]